MNTLFKDKKFSYRQLLIKCAIFIVTVSVITYFMPKEGKFNYQFELNKPWKYGLLQASFDFPIYKADEQVKAEQDSILQFYMPYYKITADTYKEIIQKLRNEYKSNHILNEHPGYYKHVEALLAEIYETGIIASTDINQLEQEGVSTIQIISNNTAAQKDIDELYTIKEAYEKLVYSDTAEIQSK